MSKQRIWQIKNKEKGLCTQCTSPAVNKSFCEKHRITFNLYLKRRRQKKTGNSPKTLIGHIKSYTTLKERGLI